MEHWLEIDWVSIPIKRLISMEICSLNFVKTSVADVYSLKASVPLLNHLKTQKNPGFLMFSVGIEMKHRLKIG